MHRQRSAGCNKGILFNKWFPGNATVKNIRQICNHTENAMMTAGFVWNVRFIDALFLGSTHGLHLRWACQLPGVNARYKIITKCYNYDDRFE